MSFGRGSAICEYDEIMQILPGSSDDARLIEALSGIRNIREATRGTLKIENRKIPGALMPCPAGAGQVRLLQQHHHQAQAEIEQRQHEEGVAIAHHHRLAVHDLG
jgi:hypothetical protein